MIRHIVMWKVRGNSSEERRQTALEVKQQFEGLSERIPGLLHLEVGLDVSAVDHACDVVLVTDFESPEALSAYAEHPEHLRVRRALGDARITRHQVDYVVDALEKC